MQNTHAASNVRIGLLAAEFGLNPKTIRYYEAIGLLPTPQRSGAGYRLYDDTHREQLRFIGQGKAAGFTLAEMGAILTLWREGQRPCQHVLTLLDHKLTAVDEHLRRLTAFRQQLRTMRVAATETMHTSAGVCAIIEQHDSSH